MSIPDKKNTEEIAKPSLPHRDPEIYDPPPSYTPYKSPSNHKPLPPPLPNEPPALTRDSISDSSPRISDGLGPQVEDYTIYLKAIWDDIKGACYLAVSWPWTFCIHYLGCCPQILREAKLEQNQ